MKILYASPEAVPFAKTGGLADVAGALPKTLAQMGHEVTLILPKYRQVDDRRFRLTRAAFSLRVPIAQKVETAEVCSSDLGPHFQALLIRKDAYYDRDQLYGTPEGDFEDNAERFTFFSRSIVEAALEIQPDIIHCNDWQTGLVPVYLKTLYAKVPQLAKSASVFTIHNIGYQGLFLSSDLPMTNLGWELFTPQALEFHGKLNFLKGGIVFSDALTTVSRKYMEEIQTPELGFGLDGVLRERKGDLYGILNGVDYEEWSPDSDAYIQHKYSPADLQGKKYCKADLQREFGLPLNEGSPLMGAISRLVAQKGFDLIAGIMEELMNLGIQFVLLGAGEERYQRLFESMHQKYPRQVSVKLAFDNRLAHKIEAGADMFLIPSHYEPCGLNQIYSLKYGTVPIVRATGGLDDSVQDFNPVRGEGNGFKFTDYSSSSLLLAVKRALKAYENRPLWEQLMIRGMSLDFSWASSAKAYLKVYQHVLEKKEKRTES